MSIQVVIPIKQYAKTAAQLAADNFVHVNRQLVIASDTGVFKLGDGVTAYNSLPALFTSSSAWGGITGTLSAQTDLQNALNAKQATLVSATNIKTINGSAILGSGDLSVTDATKLPLSGGTLTGNLLFTDNTYDIGASGATRPRRGYFGTSILTPLLGVNNLSPTAQIDVKGNGSQPIGLFSNASGSSKIRFAQLTNSASLNLDCPDGNNNIISFHRDGDFGTYTSRFLFANGASSWDNNNLSDVSYFAFQNGGNNRLVIQNKLISMPFSPTSSANYGLFSLGNSPFDGSTSGFFNGSANGTLIAGNISGSADFINLQKAGVQKFKVDNNGAISIASMADGTAPNSSLYFSTTASKLVWKDSGGTVNNLY